MNPDNLAHGDLAPEHLAPEHLGPEHGAPDPLPPDHLAPDELTPAGVGATGHVAARHAAADVFDPDPLRANGPDAMSPSVGPLGLLNDVDMEVTVELGRTTMPIRELLALQPGMVVEIDRAAGSPIDVLVNGRLIARGEVVVIDEEFGVRVTEIVAVRDMG